jgi:ADP-ribose pyrophosphatase YjhB (NUDIX family)
MSKGSKGSKRYPTMFSTVDIGAYRFTSEYTKELLLGRKAGSKLWCLPGGFVDPKDCNFEHSAARELYEETGLFTVNGLIPEGQFKIDDPRYRDSEDKILTNLFTCDIGQQTPVAGDDLEEVAWINRHSLHYKLKGRNVKIEEILVPHHLILFNKLMQ